LAKEKVKMSWVWRKRSKNGGFGGAAFGQMRVESGCWGIGGGCIWEAFYQSFFARFI